MFRVFRFPLLAEAAAGAKTTTKRKKKWIDRRSHKVPHGGREVFSVYDQPACALCHVRFRWKEDYQTHKQSPLHQAREKWAETEKWWASVGEKAHHQRSIEDEEILQRVLEKRSAASGIGIQALSQSMRRAHVNLRPKHDAGLDDSPAGKPEIVEPRDNRWPASPKW